MEPSHSRRRRTTKWKRSRASTSGRHSQSRRGLLRRKRGGARAERRWIGWRRSVGRRRRRHIRNQQSSSLSLRLKLRLRMASTLRPRTHRPRSSSISRPAGTRAGCGRYQDVQADPTCTIPPTARTPSYGRRTHSSWSRGVWRWRQRRRHEHTRERKWRAPRWRTPFQPRPRGA